MQRIKMGIVVVGMLLSFFLVSSNIAAAEEGVTDNEIVVGSISDLSGPLAFMGKGERDGEALYFAYINDQGGIHGRKIKFVSEDDQFQSPRTVLALKKLITKDKIFALSLIMGAGNIFACIPLIDQYKIPLFPSGTANEALAYPPRKYVFVTDTGYGMQGRIAIKYILNDMKAKNPKFGVIYQDDVTGQQWLQGIKDGCKNNHQPEPFAASYKRGAIDFSSQVALCKQNGITHVLYHGNVREPGAMMKEAKRLQYKAVWFGNAAAGDDKIVELAGDAVDYSNGMYHISYFRHISENTESFKLFKECVKKYGIGAVDNRFNQWSFSAGMNFCEVLKRAGRNLTREGFIKAAESLKDYDNGMTAPITFGPDRRDGGRHCNIFKGKNGTWNLYSGGNWITE